MTAASAATGAVAGNASAEIVEINFQNQIYSVQNGVESTTPLNLDVTGDNNDDFSVFEGVPLTDNNVISTQNPSLFYNKRGAGLQIDTRALSVQMYVNLFYTTQNSNPGGNFFRGQVGSQGDDDPLPFALTGFAAILFSDAGINSGQSTFGYLQIRVSSTSTIDHAIEIQKLIFDNTSRTLSVPDILDYPDFVRGAVPPPSVDPAAVAAAAQKVSVQKKLKSIKKKLKKARKSKKKAQLKKLKKAEKKLKATLRALG
ncbi:MAG: hypothetical protein AAGC68_11500 [Verrucomicrobiota bacterium]